MNLKRITRTSLLILALALVCCVPALAAGSGDVASAVEQTWQDAATQIKTVVDDVVFPALDMILVVAFFAKIAMAYFDYKQRGQFEWTGPVILFACLVFTLTAPLYIWGIIGI
jgi:type IV secretory pathway VirB2 component (pilin)